MSATNTFVYIDTFYDSLSLLYGNRKIKVGDKNDCVQKKGAQNCIQHDILIVLE